MLSFSRAGKGRWGKGRPDSVSTRWLAIHHGVFARREGWGEISCFSVSSRRPLHRWRPSLVLYPLSRTSRLSLDTERQREREKCSMLILVWLAAARGFTPQGDAHSNWCSLQRGGKRGQPSKQKCLRQQACAQERGHGTSASNANSLVCAARAQTRARGIGNDF